MAPVLKTIREKPQASTSCKKAVLAFADKVNNLAWIQNLLYLFMQQTTIENADLQTFGVAADEQQLNELEAKQRTLNTLAECMSFLLKKVRSKSKENAVPLALAESTLKVAKGLILASFTKSEASEKEIGIVCYSLSLQEVFKSETDGSSLLRREAGWILLEGLLGLGDAWVTQNQEILLALFYSMFNKEMCATSGFSKVSEIIREFDLKHRALKTLHYFITNFRWSILGENKSYLKFVA
mmetsp:Transcript_7475/g.11658  ORF Transcript_7475/g.11658 Transcript_7475/m.11658 type:complete len:240 (-) Transcript_7475:2056-2775(-)